MADRSVSWSSDAGLAVTKLYIPDRRAGLIERKPLVRLLCANNHARLTLISAPPGAGKTTLLAEWQAAAEETRPFARLSLDADDRDPVRFWAAVLAALRTVHPGFGQRTRPRCAAPAGSCKRSWCRCWSTRRPRWRRKRSSCWTTCT